MVLQDIIGSLHFMSLKTSGGVNQRERRVEGRGWRAGSYFCPYWALSTELTRGLPRVSSALSFIGGVHISARAVHVLNLIWFGLIARLSKWEGGGG